MASGQASAADLRDGVPTLALGDTPRVVSGRKRAVKATAAAARLPVGDDASPSVEPERSVRVDHDEVTPAAMSGGSKGGHAGKKKTRRKGALSLSRPRSRRAAAVAASTAVAASSAGFEAQLQVRLTRVSPRLLALLLPRFRALACPSFCCVSCACTSPDCQLQEIDSRLPFDALWLLLYLAL